MEWEKFNRRIIEPTGFDEPAAFDESEGSVTPTDAPSAGKNEHRYGKTEWETA